MQMSDDAPGVGLRSGAVVEVRDVVGGHPDFGAFWWARVTMRFLDSVHLFPVTCIAFGVVPLPVARWSVFVAGGRALRTFLRGDHFWGRYGYKDRAIPLD